MMFPESDAVVFGPGDAGAQFGFIVPAPPASALPGAERAVQDGLPSVVHSLASLPEEPGKLPREVDMLLLDFRNNPDEIGTFLDWILPAPA